MVERFFADFRRVNENLQIFLDLFLPDVFHQFAGSQGRFKRTFLVPPFSTNCSFRHTFIIDDCRLMNDELHLSDCIRCCSANLAALKIWMHFGAIGRNFWRACPLCIVNAIVVCIRRNLKLCRLPATSHKLVALVKQFERPACPIAVSTFFATSLTRSCLSPNGGKFVARDFKNWYELGIDNTGI
jgi:hypothetical protein